MRDHRGGETRAGLAAASAPPLEGIIYRPLHTHCRGPRDKIAHPFGPTLNREGRTRSRDR
eukprot:3580344-Prymnesium_polylepis.4